MPGASGPGGSSPDAGAINGMPAPLKPTGNAAAATDDGGSSSSLEAGLRVPASTKQHERAQAHLQGPVRKLAQEPSRTMMVRSERAWRRFNPVDGAGRRHHRRYVCRSVLGLPMLSPLSVWVERWDAAMSTLDITYTAFLVPLSVGFSSVSAVDWLVALDFAVAGVYLLDLLLCLHVGFVLQSWDGRRTVVVDGPTCMRQYVQHGYFLWDVAAVLAVIPEIVLVSVGGGNVAWKLFYFLRMLRLLRVVRLARAIWGAALSCGPGGSVFLFELTSAGMYGLSVMWVLFVIVNLLGCFWWWLAEVQGVHQSWVEGPYVPTQLHLGDLAAASAPVRWLYSCYFALSTVTTAVYGDTICTTVPEIVTVMVYDFFSVFWWACIVTLIFEVMQTSSRRAHKASVLLDKLFEAEAWMQDRLLPGDLQQKVRRYYAEVWLPLDSGQDAEQLRQLPAVLRGEVVWRVLGPTLRASRLLSVLPEEVLLFLAADLEPRYLPAGLELFRQGGDSQGACFLLQSGEVEVLRGWRRVASVRAPALLGQAALLQPHTTDCPETDARLHTVRAVTGCSVWRLAGADLAMLMQEDPATLHSLAAAFLKYLDGLLEPVTLAEQAPSQLAPAGPSHATTSAAVLDRRNIPGPISSLRQVLLALLEDRDAGGDTATTAALPSDSAALHSVTPKKGSAQLAGGPHQGKHGSSSAITSERGRHQQRQQWVERQRLVAAAASAMQEQPEAPLWTE